MVSLKNISNINILNFFIALFPISYFLGNLIINLNTLIVSILGIVIFKSEIFKLKKNEFLIFSFFLLILFSTFLNYFFFKNLETNNVLKSILFLRYFILFLTVNILVTKKLFNFNLFFKTTFISLSFIGADVIIQFIFGFNIIGFALHENHASSLFGDELIAGGYLIKFFYFFLIFLFILFKDNILKNDIPFIFLISLFFIATIFAGNRMPIILFLVGLFLFFFLTNQKKTQIIISFILCITIFAINYKFDDSFRWQFERFDKASTKIYKNLRNKILVEELKIETKSESIDKIHVESSKHYKIYITAIDSWKDNKIIGGGIRSFRINCKKYINLNEQDMMELIPSIYEKQDRTCESHPHNYYLEVLTDTGLAGVLIIFLIICHIIFRSYKVYILDRNSKNFLIFLTIFMSLFVEFFPLQSTGSIFSTFNATFIFLILGLIWNLHLNVENKKK